MFNKMISIEHVMKIIDWQQSVHIVFDEALPGNIQAVIRKKFNIDVEYVGGRGFGSLGSSQVGYVLSVPKNVSIVIRAAIVHFVNMRLNGPVKV